MKHPAFRSGDFDTNFIKHYFEDPKIMHEAQEEEKRALVASLDQIWNHLKATKKREFASKLID